MPKQPNIYDVAVAAKVSHQTVSRVINHSPSIKPETKSRVLLAMETLGYRPNLAARALASSKTNMLGILTSDTDFTGPASMAHHMERAARAQGFFVVTCGIDSSDEKSVKDGIEHLMKLGIEGMAVIAPQLEAVEVIRKMVGSVPVVTLDSMHRMDELAVSVDNFSGGSAATQHLVDLGHRNIVHISGPKNWFESTARAAGYTATMLTAGLTPRVIEGDWELSTGHRIGLEVNLESKALSAFFIANDRMAIGFLHAMRQRGISVPGQVSVVGFDDLEESGYCWPPLTTLRQDFKELGKRAMSLLLDEILGKPVRKLDQLVPDLVIRDSTSVAAESTGQ